MPTSGAKAGESRPRAERGLPASETNTDADLGVRGTELSEEESAALVAVLAQLASAEPAGNDAGGTGPADRTLQRKHRLDSDQHGLWGRPGPASWKQATGGLR
ncbi:hypothetical protein [Nesterenkonia muleiensis]|uniref:hypothetical protein n=1 Tax=Nesterenkonia muleiensis TaxID=2282648 RepID=UPI001300A289|nr:hypothetical protein [Nesterenkonia muleiensis]